MKSSSVAIVDLLRLSFAGLDRWPKPFHLIQGALAVESGSDLVKTARLVGTTPAHLMEAVTSPDAVEAVLRVTDSEISEEALKKLRRNVGSLVLGRAAEIVFEDIIRAGVDSVEFSIRDLREGRTNTDYRLLNGGSRPLYRFNVKFFGSVFRRGAEMVSLAPFDCSCAFVWPFDEPSKYEPG